MAYRDLALTCPRCHTPLARVDGQDKWRCPTCHGTLVGRSGLTLGVGPALLGPVADATADGLPCPACAAAMEPLWLDEMSLERCVEDGVVWFESAPLVRRPAEW